VLLQGDGETRADFALAAQLRGFVRSEAEPGARFAERIWEYVCKIWTRKPEHFHVGPFQHNVGLNT
jgi:hypothetical protein